MKKIGVALILAVLIFSISPVFSYSSLITELLNSGAKIASNALFDNDGNFQSGDISLGDTEKNIGNLISSNLTNGDISAKDVELSKSSGLTKVTFDSKNSFIKVKENSFENIVPQSDANHPTYVTLDGSGQVTEADFTTNEKGGIYTLGGTKFNLPANSRVYYSKEKGLILPDNSEISNSPLSGVVTGDNVKLPGGDKISGVWKYSNGNMLVLQGNKININGLDITNSKNMNKNDLSVFFDGEKHSGRYVSLGDRTLHAGSPDYEGPLIQFSKDNSYIKIEDNDYAALKLGTNSEISIENRDGQGLIPKMTTKGNFILDNGGKSLEYKDGKFFLNRYNQLSSGEQTSGTSPLDISLPSDQSLTGLGTNTPSNRIIVDNSNRWGFNIPENTEAQLITKGSKSVMFSSKLDYNYYQSGWNFQELGLDKATYQKLSYAGEYVNAARIKLDNALQQKYPGVDFNAIKKGAETITNPNLNNYISNMQDYYLTPAERDAVLKGTGFEQYPQMVDELKSIYSNYGLGDTRGILESGVTSSADEKYGPYNMLYKWYSESKTTTTYKYDSKGNLVNVIKQNPSTSSNSYYYSQ